jgi:amidase
VASEFFWECANTFVLIQNPGQNTYASSVGVMGTTIDAVKLVMTSILSTQPWIRDPAVVSMPWNSDVEKSTLARASADGAANEKQPLKLGVFWSDGVVGPQPPIKRGLRLVHEVLESMGHRVRYG